MLPAAVNSFLKKLFGAYSKREFHRQDGNLAALALATRRKLGRGGSLELPAHASKLGPLELINF